VTAGGAVEVVPGVLVYPRPGWTATSTESGLRLQKGSRTVDVRVDPTFAGSPLQLYQAYVTNVLQPQAGATTGAPQATQLTVADPEVTSLGGRRAAAGAYSGIFQGVPGTLEGELIAIVTAGGEGIVFDAYAPEGSLRAATDDIESMASTVEAR
jgi:hypothetical protein